MLSRLAICVTFVYQEDVSTRAICPALCLSKRCKITLEFETHGCFSDEDHVRHMCDNRLACTIACDLCSRLCAMGDHFHGLDGDALHLCGYVAYLS